MKNLSKKEIFKIVIEGLVSRGLFILCMITLIMPMFRIEIDIIFVLIGLLFVVFFSLIISISKKVQKIALKWEAQHIRHILGRKEWWCDQKEQIKEHDQKRYEYLRQLNLEIH